MLIAAFTWVIEFSLDEAGQGTLCLTVPMSASQGLMLLFGSWAIWAPGM